jgi:hypothetical protein
LRDLEDEIFARIEDLALMADIEPMLQEDLFLLEPEDIWIAIDKGCSKA